MRLRLREKARCEASTQCEDEHETSQKRQERGGLKRAAAEVMGKATNGKSHHRDEKREDGGLCVRNMPKRAAGPHKTFGTALC